MLRTNESFLAYAQLRYEEQERKENIVLKQYQKGQRILHQGEPATKVMLISEGLTKCLFSEANDKEFIFEFLGRGEIIGELECIRDIPCLCSIEAINEVTLYAFSVPFFRDLLQKDLQLNHLLLESFAARMMNTSSRASFQQLHTLEHSLGKLLDLQSRQNIQLSKEDMAAYLGVSVRSLNRSLKNLPVT